ncbi:hypothetical protein SASPL_103923 [Salvia splendens]|uniref:Uncharacterized protein n=1 Tax=Salvia splendens TaxID=180675 RepID=A0A8X9A788_SALSN|nr:hypothetical protein SASPL_103923 [Salvia splendens]
MGKAGEGNAFAFQGSPVSTRNAAVTGEGRHTWKHISCKTYKLLNIYEAISQAQATRAVLGSQALKGPCLEMFKEKSSYLVTNSQLTLPSEIRNCAVWIVDHLTFETTRKPNNLVEALIS